MCHFIVQARIISVPCYDVSIVKYRTDYPTLKNVVFDSTSFRVRHLHPVQAGSPCKYEIVAMIFHNDEGRLLSSPHHCHACQ